MNSEHTHPSATKASHGIPEWLVHSHADADLPHKHVTWGWSFKDKERGQTDGDR